jgi:hypothetical protein
VSLVDQLAEMLRHGLTDSQAAHLASLLRSGPPSSQDKATKLEANYREADGDGSCADCRYFSAGPARSGLCDLVTGNISPHYVCDWYEPADKPAGRQGSAAADSGGDHYGRRRRDSLGNLQPHS